MLPIIITNNNNNNNHNSKLQPYIINPIRMRLAQCDPKT
jgi:hypothetical protein